MKTVLAIGISRLRRDPHPDRYASLPSGQARGQALPLTGP